MSDAKRTFTLKTTHRVIVQLVIGCDRYAASATLSSQVRGIGGEAWVYAVTATVGFLLSRWLAAKRHPDILAERARSMELQDAKPWDRILAPVMGLGSIVILIVAGIG